MEVLGLGGRGYGSHPVGWHLQPALAGGTNSHDRLIATRFETCGTPGMPGTVGASKDASASVHQRPLRRRVAPCRPCIRPRDAAPQECPLLVNCSGVQGATGPRRRPASTPRWSRLRTSITGPGSVQTCRATPLAGPIVSAIGSASPDGTSCRGAAWLRSSIPEPCNDAWKPLVTERGLNLVLELAGQHLVLDAQGHPAEIVDHVLANAIEITPRSVGAQPRGGRRPANGDPRHRPKTHPGRAWHDAGTRPPLEGAETVIESFWPRIQLERHGC